MAVLAAAVALLYGHSQATPFSVRFSLSSDNRFAEGAGRTVPETVFLFLRPIEAA